MGIFNKSTEIVTDTVERLSGVADKYITTKEEKAAFLESAQTIMNNVVQERLRIDMSSDSWMSKNIRPLSLSVVVGGYILINVIKMFLHTIGIDVVIDDGFVSIMKDWGGTMIAFYFGIRGIEKVADIVLKNRKGNV